MNQRMVELMRAEGLPYGERTHTYNSRLAQELGKWADACGVEAIHDILYRAYFVENRNIMGATNPKDAKPGTIRKLYGVSIDKNSVHGSDSIDNAKKEIEFFFKN